MRTIRKSATRSALDVLDLLAALLALEVVRPSRCLWLASPWVTDLPIIDNRFGDFPALDPVGRRKVTLSEVLVAIACESATVVVATRRDPINDGFTERLRQLAILHDVEDQVSVQFVAPADRMHGKVRFPPPTGHLVMRLAAE